MKIFRNKLTIIVAAFYLTMTFAFTLPAYGQTNAQKAAQGKQLYDEAIDLIETGTTESLQMSLIKFEKACHIARELNEKENEAHCLAWTGRIYNTLGNIQKSLEYYKQALSLFQGIKSAKSEAELLTLIGEIYSYLGEIQQALDFYTQALPIFKAINNKKGEAIIFNYLGTVYSALGEKQKALDYFAQSLLIRKSIDDKSGESQTLSNIGLVFYELGDNQQALNYFNESLSVDQTANKSNKNSATLNNIGLVYNALDEKQKALKYFNESLSISQANNDKKGQATTLNSIGGVYSSLGEKLQALKFYNESLLLRRAVNDRYGAAVTINNIASIYNVFGERQQALKYFNESLSLFREMGNRNGIATTLGNIGEVYDLLGDKQKGLVYYNESLSVRRELGDRRGEAIILNNIAALYTDLGDNQKALEYLKKSLPLRRAVDDKSGEANTLDMLFYTFATTNPRLGIFYAKQSVNNLQILRSNVQGFDKTIQQTFLKSVEKTYRRLADTLIAQGRYAETQQVLNSFKDQQFFDFNQNKQFAPLAVTAREAELTATLNQKLENAVASIRALDEYKRGIGQRQPNAVELAQIQTLTARQNAADANYQAFLKTAEKEFAAPPSEKDKVPDVRDLREMQTALREVSTQTGEKSVAVYTLVGEENYRALIITADSISSVSTPIKSAVLNDKAVQLWSFLRKPEYDPKMLSKEVYDVVFAPLAAKLPADTKTILWSLDGNLRYLPMAALFDGKQYLVERFNNVIFTRADRERLTGNVSVNLNGTGFGSSQKHRVTIGDDTFYARELPSVKTELTRIFKTGNSPNGILAGEVLLDGKFTRPAMIAALQKRRPLVHIASHFRFVAGDEANSFLLLGDGTPFTLDEMKGRKNLFDGVELLTLSACETAAQREGNGREVDGFAELAQRLGAGAVMASLWKVQDASTAELMTRFYKNYNGQKGSNKANSLRDAQIALLRGEYKTAAAGTRQLTREDAEIEAVVKIDKAKRKLFVIDKNAPFAHPFYWSPFVLIGNWK